MTEAGAVTWGEPTDVGFAVEAVDACASPLISHVVERNIAAHHLMTASLLSKRPLVKSSICTTLLYGQLLLVLAPAQRLQMEGRQAKKARKAGKAAKPPNALKEKTNCNMT